MSRKFLALPFALLVAALIAGCGAAPAPVPPPPTKTPKPTFTPTIAPTDIPFATLAPTSVPATVAPAATEAQAQPTAAGAEGQATAAPSAATGAPTAEPTKAAPVETRLTATQNVNVRSGPGTAYPAIGRLNSGESFAVTGRNDAGDWVKFDFNGKEGWVTAALVTVEGDLNGVAIAQAPAIPTARPQPTARPRPTNPPAQPTNPPAPPQPQFPFQLVQGSGQCTEYGGTPYFNGLVKYRDGNLHNGVCVHIAFYGPRQTKCSGCGGVGAGIWGFAPFGDSPAPSGTTVEIFVVSCQGVPEGGQNGNFSDLTPKSEKFTYTFPASGRAKCENITFVGD